MTDTPRTDETFNRCMKFAGKVDACEVFKKEMSQLERELAAAQAERDQWREMAVRLGKSLNHQNENWGLYGNESQQTLAAFNAMSEKGKR